MQNISSKTTAPAKPRKTWSEADNEYMWDHYVALGPYVLAEYFNVNATAVKKQMYTLRIKKKKEGEDDMQRIKNVPIGTRRIFNDKGKDREFIKTEKGWVRYHPLGYSTYVPVPTGKKPYTDDRLKAPRKEKKKDPPARSNYGADKKFIEDWLKPDEIKVRDIPVEKIPFKVNSKTTVYIYPHQDKEAILRKYNPKEL